MAISTKRNGSLEKLTVDKYFNLIEHAADGIAILQDGVFKLVNTALARISGYNKEELLGMPITKLLTPESQKLAMARYQARLAGKEVPSIYEIKAVTKDGEARDIEINATLTEYEGRVADEVIIRDITERKQAEEALRQSEGKLQAYLESAPDGVYINDLKGAFLYGNKKAEEIIGYKREELLGKSFLKLNLLPAKYLAKVGKLLALNAMGKPTGPDEFELMRRDGTRIWVEITTTPIKQAEGKTEVIGFVRDITERKQAEEALQQSNRRFSDIVENALEWIWEVDAKGKYTYVSPVVEKILGYKPEEVVKKHFYDLLHPDDREELKKAAFEVFAKKQSFREFINRNIHKNGEIIWLSTSGVPILDEEGNLLGYRGADIDITERKRAEEALERQQAYFQQLFDNSPEAIAWLDDTDRVVQINKGFETLFGYRAQEIKGQLIYDIVVPKDRIEEASALSQAASNNKARRIETVRKRKDGSLVDVSIVGYPIRFGNKTVGVYAIYTDITERKQAEEALRESEERYRAVIEGAHDMIQSVAPDGSIIFVNQAWLDALGYTKAELPSLNLFEIIHPDSQSHCQELFAKVLNGEPVHGVQATFLTKDGRKILVEGNAAPRYIEGEVVATQGIFHNITERKQMEQQLRENNEQLDAQNEELKAINEELRATEQQLQENNEQLDAQNEELRATEEELQQSQERLERMFESVTDGIVVANLDGTILKVNEKAVQMHGFASEDELLGKNAFELVAPRNHKRIANNMRKALKEGLIRAQEYTLFRADGSEFPGELSTSALKDAWGNVIGHITIARDITRRKRIEETLRESEEFNSNLLENSPNPIEVINPDTSIRYVNPAFEKLTGFTLAEIAGRKAPHLWWPEESRGEITASLKRTIATGGRRRERIFQKKNGERFWVAINSASIMRDGKLIYLLINWADITERKQAEERERQLQQELNLASRLASIGGLAAGVAHEINNPLTGVIGFSHLLMSRDIPDDMKQDLQVINSEAQRVAKIVENLLTFAHQRKPGREYVDINNIIARVLELRSYEMKVNNIEVETQLAPDLPCTMADAGQLQQVFLDIVLNAEHFITTAHNKGKLLVKTERIDDNIRASFTDDGSGISKENLDKIFNPFFTTKEVGNGTGLGLSICHGIITQHKGRIYAQSELGQGATFVVELPIVDDSNQAKQAEITKDEPEKPGGAKILVVDDEPAILAFLRRLLTEWGHSVETINNANAALDRIKTERYSLILLDIKLPGMSGVELYRHIEAIAPALTRRIIFITGDVMETATRDFLDRTKAPHITKPLDIELLKKTINHALNQTHAAATTPG